MKNSINTSKNILLGLLSIILCNKINAQSVDDLKYIPKNAQNIYVLNTPALIKKADINSLKELTFIKDILTKSKTENSRFNSILQNPKESGISFTKPIILTLSPIDSTTFNQMNLIIPLADAALFSKMMASSSMQMTKASEITISKGDSNAIAWNQEVVIFSSLEKKKKEAVPNFNPDGTLDSTAAEKPITLPSLKPEALFLQNKSKNPRVDSVLTMMKTPHDIYIYQNTDGSSKSPKAMMAGMLFNITPEDLDNNITAGWADFENGRIYGETQQRMNPTLQEKFGALFHKKPSVDWNKYISAELSPKTIGTFSFSLNPDGIKKLITESPMLKKGLEKAESKSEKKGSIDAMFKALGGDIFATAAMGSKEMEFMVGISIKDKEAVKKILTDDLHCIEIMPNLYKMAEKKPVADSATVDVALPNAPKSNKPRPYILIKDDVALIGTQSTLDPIMSPTFRGSVAATDWQKGLKNMPFNMHINMVALMNIGGAAASEKLGGIPIESLMMTSGNGTSSFELKMLDKGKNALYSLIEIMDTIAQKKAQQREMEEQMLKNEYKSSKKDSTLPDDDGN